MFASISTARRVRHLATFEPLEVRNLLSSAVGLDASFGSAGAMQTHFGLLDEEFDRVIVLKDGRALA